MRSSGDFPHDLSHIHALALIAYRQLSFTSLFLKSLGSHTQLVPQPISHGYHAFGLKLKEKAEAFLGLITGRKLPCKIWESAPTGEP